MKLLIQIPCYNEAETLPLALADLPRSLPGIDAIEVLVIDDGSQDGTAEVARRLGVDHVVGFSKNQGLANAFMLGIRSCLERGADIIVNTDADNQYVGQDIAKIVEPVLARRADLVIGTRPIQQIDHFSPLKKLLQRLGSRVVAMASGTPVEDAPSGFRAYSRAAAASLNVFSGYTYTLETIVQAGQKNLGIVCVPVRVNPPTRPSRLVRSIASYVFRSVFTLIRILIVYQPFKFLFAVGASAFAAGTAIGLRFLWHFFHDTGEGHVQSLILAAVLLIIGFQTLALAFVADVARVNRRLLEEIQTAQRLGKR
ncbi:MAG TPA: glycosyltransferase family 2 protein [Polyangiaceae bacterium]|jgi:glycosyltransferase involved in cell wall biosynthesis|nr:glycosyltransferase family 2 protein [Polyangiaceae bacterium]